MKYGAGFFVALFLLSVGYCIGTTEHKSTFSDVKWTDIGMLIITFFGFAFSFLTYFKWLSNKRKEDAYLASKNYIASIDEIEDHLHELRLQYEHLVPAPGVPDESKDISLKRIEHLNNVWNHLYQSRQRLYKTHRELRFWNVKLTDRFSTSHKDMDTLLENISAVSFALNNQLYHFIESGMRNMDSIIQHKKRFNELYKEIHLVTQNRVTHGFNEIFRYD